MTSLDAARTMPGVDEEGLLETHFIKARFYTPLPTLHVRYFKSSDLKTQDMQARRSCF